MIHSEATAVVSSARWSCGRSSDPLQGRGQSGYTPRRPSDTVSDAGRPGDIRAHGAETPFGGLNSAIIRRPYPVRSRDTDLQGQVNSTSRTETET